MIPETQEKKKKSTNMVDSECYGSLLMLTAVKESAGAAQSSSAFEPSHALNTQRSKTTMSTKRLCLPTNLLCIGQTSSTLSSWVLGMEMKPKLEVSVTNTLLDKSHHINTCDYTCAKRTFEAACSNKLMPLSTEPCTHSRLPSRAHALHTREDVPRHGAVLQRKGKMAAKLPRVTTR
jgi:hypothetical protein